MLALRVLARRRVVCSASFQTALHRRLALLRRLKSVLYAGVVTISQKLKVLTSLPLFANLSRYEQITLAKLMRLKLVGRYTTVLRAGSAPPAFNVVLWGSLRVASGRPDGIIDVVGVGGAIGLSLVQDEKLCRPLIVVPRRRG